MEENLQKKTFNLAAIDIGSNAARILIKRVEMTPKGIRTKKQQFVRIPLRLGIDVFSIGKIGEEREQKLIRTIKLFRQLLIIYNVQDYRACATSAFRDAKNGKKILHYIKKHIKMDVEIISGDEEAHILRDCNQPTASDGTKNLLYMDVGGGSTELSLVCDGKLMASNSFNIGTLRLLANTVPQTEWDKMRCHVCELCKNIPNVQIIGSGGNINKLYRLTAKSERKADSIPVSSLQKLYSALSALTVEERMEMYDLREYRADVIVPAAQLFLMVADASGAEYITVPNVGLADGIINMMAENICNKKDR